LIGNVLCDEAIVIAMRFSSFGWTFAIRVVSVSIRPRHIEAIQLAFADVPRGAVSLHEAQLMDDYASPKERAAARRLDTQSNWNRVSDSAIEQCTSALCHLDPEGWRHYVPAYMIWSLRNFRETESLVSDSMIYTFNLPEDDERLRDHHLARYQLLDEPSIPGSLPVPASHGGE